MDEWVAGRAGGVCVNLDAVLWVGESVALLVTLCVFAEWDTRWRDWDGGIS